MKKFFLFILAVLFIFLCITIYQKYPVWTITQGGYVPPLPDAVVKKGGSQASPAGQWTWEYSVDNSGKRVVPKDSEDFILTLTLEGRLTSTTDCNTVSGSYVKNETSMNIGALVTTEKACRGETFESVYINSLSRVVGYAYAEGDMLVLYLIHNSGMMIFSQK
jgi:heat shock protein HslJ